MRREPNAGHEALAALSRDRPNVRIITQNVDGLHCSAHAALGNTNVQSMFDRLIEAHGRVGLYKCSSPLPDEGGSCPYSSAKSIHPHFFGEESTRRQLGHGVDVPERMERAPCCPHCGCACLPQALLFDEDYSDHDFYQFDKLQSWLAEAEAFLFVGTSFAVTLTSLAVEEARVRRLPMFNLNIDDDPERAARPTLRWHDVVGRAEEKLPVLLSMVQSRS
jgi:NAD-dependent deacetylase